jgi:hypothetical protein
MPVQANDKISEIYRKLMNVNNTESSLNAIEGLFYEALSVAREEQDNDLLVKLKKIESEEYKQVLTRPQTKSRKEAAIKTFRHTLKNILNEKKATTQK